jgi:hypothetical protein
MILAAPPAAAITYVKPSSGLDPSEYAGGGSLSSSLFDDSPFVSCGRAAFVSATTSRGVVVGSRGSNATGAYAGTVADAPASVTAVLYASTASAVEV